jgi:hypothetical protein
MEIKTTTDQIDLICRISIILKKTPYTYTDTSVIWESIEGCLVVDFEKSEMQFTDWHHDDDIIYFQLLGVCHFCSLEPEEYTRN